MGLQLPEHISNFLHCIIYEHQVHLPASELICLRDVWVDHHSAAEGCREGPASKVRKFCTLNCYNGLSRAIKLFSLHKARDKRRDSH